MGRKIKIIRCPSLNYNFSGIPPLGLATITAVLQHNGYDITQDDLDAKCAYDGKVFPRHRWGKEFLEKTLMKDIPRIRNFWEGGKDLEVVDLVKRVLSFSELEDFDTILLSCYQGDDCAAVLALCIGKYLREHLGKFVIIGGEAYPHMEPIRKEVAYFANNGCFDYYIQGYGEIPLCELFKQLDESNPVDGVPGIVFPKGDNEIVENPPLFTRPSVTPNFDGLPIDLYYKYPDEWGKFKPEDEGVDKILVLPLKLNYNCPMNCAFCICSGDSFRKLTWMNSDEVAKAIKKLKERYNTPYFMFMDDIFNISKSWTNKMTDAFIRHDLNIMWSDCAFGRNLDRSLIQKIRKSGAVRLVWGLESGSERMQTLINKKIKFPEMEQILKWSHEAGIYNSIEMIAGLPHEKDEDVEDSIEFLKRNRPFIDQVYLNPFSLITGSLYYKKPEQYGIKNIKPIRTIFDSKPDNIHSWIQRYTFDEVDGLKWEDKVQQIENSFQRLHELRLELGLGGHDLQTIFQRFAKFGEKKYVTDFQSSRKHQSFDFFGSDSGPGQESKGHTPVKTASH